MFAQHVSRNSQAGSKSESNSEDAADWTKGLIFVQQTFITQELKKNKVKTL